MLLGWCVFDFIVFVIFGVLVLYVLCLLWWLMFGFGGVLVLCWW